METTTQNTDIPDNVRELPMARIRARRFEPIKVTASVQITAVICITFVLLAIVGAVSASLGGA